MKKIIITISALLLVVAAFTGCEKYEPSGDPTWNDSKVTPVRGPVRQVVYVANNNQIWASDFTGVSKKLLATPTSTVTNISISPNCDKIAYKQSNLGIVIIDSTGKVLQTNIPNTTNVEYFEWYHDNNLLYGIDNTATTYKPIKIYGTSELPTGLPTPILPGTSIKLLRFCYITKDNDIFYSGYANNAFKLGYIRNGETSDTKIGTYSAVFYGYTYDRLHVNRGGTGIALNYSYNKGEQVSFSNRSFYQTNGSQSTSSLSCEIHNIRNNIFFGSITVTSQGDINTWSDKDQTGYNIGTGSISRFPVFDFK